MHGAGNGPVDAFVAAVRTGLALPIHVLNYHEHAIGAGEDAHAVAYVQLRVGTDRTVYGVGRDANIVTATLRALTSAINRGINAGMMPAPKVQSAVA
jgi:2-isopropylmalate synthase